jgi:nucleoid DNA-binding protein
MHELVTSFLIQSKHCRLKDIGNFSLVHSSAKSDIANKKIVARHVEVVYSPREEKTSEELIKYVAHQKKISMAASQEQLKQWCAETSTKLKNGEEIFFKPLGFLKKSATGINFFQNKNIARFFEPVPALRVIHKNSEHQMLVGDREVTSTTMSQFYQAEEVITKRKRWKLIAIVLLVVAVVFLFFYFNKQPFSLSRLGNQQKVLPKTPPSTYSAQ